MRTSVKTSAAPTPVQSIAEAPEPKRGPEVFTWYRNRVDECLRELYRAEQTEKHKVELVAEDLGNSNSFIDLVNTYESASQHRLGKLPTLDHDYLTALCARMFLAGTLHRMMLLDEATVVE